jgi:hypothetical protein
MFPFTAHRRCLISFGSKRTQILIRHLQNLELAKTAEIKNPLPAGFMGSMGDAQMGTAKQIHDVNAELDIDPKNMSATSHSAHTCVAGQPEQVAAHCMPIEHGGLSMLELIDAMKKDAGTQERLAHIIADLVQETVSRNDRRY